MSRLYKFLVITAVIFQISFIEASYHPVTLSNTTLDSTVTSNNNMQQVEIEIFINKVSRLWDQSNFEL